MWVVVLFGNLAQVLTIIIGAASNLRNLQYDFRSVFTLASMGYAVVIADYVGLGSDNFFNYLAYKLHANDVVYSVVAAQSVFSQLSREWVSFGHSEGGGVAWYVDPTTVHVLCEERSTEVSFQGSRRTTSHQSDPGLSGYHRCSAAALPNWQHNAGR